MDTGKVWTPLGTSVVANWYNFANTAGSGAFPVNQAFFSGIFATGFVRKNFDVSFLAGNPKVAFRFAFKSDVNTNAAGVAIDDVEVTGPINVLPLKLINFTAAKQNKDALLKWNTTNEINVSHFNVERSWDGSTFTTLPNVAAQNNLNNSYVFTDLLSLLSTTNKDIIYYRLKSTDVNGSFSQSNIVQLKWFNGENNTITVSPNPFIDHVKINTELIINGVQLVGIKGEILFTSGKVVAGRINLPAYLTRGIYFLKINTDKGIFVEKIVKE